MTSRCAWELEREKKRFWNTGVRSKQCILDGPGQELWERFSSRRKPEGREGTQRSWGLTQMTSWWMHHTERLGEKIKENWLLEKQHKKMCNKQWPWFTKWLSFEQHLCSCDGGHGSNQDCRVSIGSGRVDIRVWVCRVGVEVRTAVHSHLHREKTMLKTETPGRSRASTDYIGTMQKGWPRGEVSWEGWPRGEVSREGGDIDRGALSWGCVLFNKPCKTILFF